MNEFEVGGNRYKNGAINVFQQQAIVKRLLPLFGNLVATFRAFQDRDTGKMVATVTQSIKELSDDDLEFVQCTCLKVVFRAQGGDKWARIMPNGGTLAFEDIGLIDLNEIVFNVLKDQLSSFFSGLDQRGLLGQKST